MIDITHKPTTYRTALAEAVVKVSLPETIEAIESNRVPKGNVFEMAKAAGLLGVKKTPDLIPDCHPLPVEYTGISYEVLDLEIRIRVEIGSVYKTGVEVEAMHGASVVALTMYDMLKPIDKKIEIGVIRLVEKRGGKSDFADTYRRDLSAAVVVCSDSISSGKKEDRAGKVIMDKLKACNVKVTGYDIIPDEPEAIREKVQVYCALGVDLLIYTGGTGLSARDVTPETIAPLLDRQMPGVMEAARSYGQARTPYSMLSRGIAGTIGHTLVLTLPGSTGGATETMDALFPSILHVFKIMRGASHEKRPE
ncbi:MAG: bifunctional molybdenum cofactor biosynthesis protein MoaC/MoaB [Flavobacteriales bacterium]|nr:bifunctional molybdenum cofactor biosynthesis protein MoaC/MoaB [Flavobacteriales bacterium]MCB9447299.1 bifunctional molybdenum cofactor biosynthesis protein MoaC/MoaB [Flavobacteriales bacterium]